MRYQAAFTDTTVARLRRKSTLPGHKIHDDPALIPPGGSLLLTNAGAGRGPAPRDVIRACSHGGWGASDHKVRQCPPVAPGSAGPCCSLPGRRDGRGPSSAKEAFAVLSPYVRRSHIRTLRTGAAVSQQCEVTQVKVTVAGPGYVGTVMVAPGPLQEP